MFALIINIFISVWRESTVRVSSGQSDHSTVYCEYMLQSNCETRNFTKFLKISGNTWNDQITYLHLPEFTKNDTFFYKSLLLHNSGKVWNIIHCYKMLYLSQLNAFIEFCDFKDTTIYFFNLIMSRNMYYVYSS